MEAVPEAYGVRPPVLDLVRTRDEACVFGHLGPDRLRKGWDVGELVRRMSIEPGRPLAAVLLDQRCVVRFGNLWANELCFRRGHSPGTPVWDVDLPALSNLGARALRRRCLRCGTSRQSGQAGG
jgi:endonuclease VIII